MNELDSVLRTMTFEFFGTGKHKIEVEELFKTDGAIILDVRALPEVESVQFRLEHHIKVLHIPTHEIPDRYNEIPQDKMVGIFCSHGTRAAIVYAYLQSRGYENVRIILGGYDTVTSQLVPGKLLKQIRSGQTGA